MKNPIDMTWEELRDLEPGTILHDEYRDGVRFIIMRGPSALCAYVGCPINHPLAGHSYENLNLSCHWGLTFADQGKVISTEEGKLLAGWPKGFYWYGWDYGHCDDATFRELRGVSGKKWLVKDVIDDAWSAIYDFKKLMKLAEEISTKAMKWRIDESKTT